jgi:hypothetical protein
MAIIRDTYHKIHKLGHAVEYPILALFRKNKKGQNNFSFYLLVILSGTAPLTTLITGKNSEKLSNGSVALF